jgi:hypothetical protein
VEKRLIHYFNIAFIELLLIFAFQKFSQLKFNTKSHKKDFKEGASEEE